MACCAVGRRSKRKQKKDWYPTSGRGRRDVEAGTIESPEFAGASERYDRYECEK